VCVCGGGGGVGGGGVGGLCFCAIQEINFLYTLHDFHQIIENINNTIFFLILKSLSTRGRFIHFSYIYERKSSSRYSQERSNSIDVSSASSFIASTEVRKELLPHYFTDRKCRPRSHRRQPDLTT